jgi:hypothetical protein
VPWAFWAQGFLKDLPSLDKSERGDKKEVDREAVISVRTCGRKFFHGKGL